MPCSRKCNSTGTDGSLEVGWGGQGPPPATFPWNYILAHIIKVLHQRVSLGLFTMFIKIRAHRGEFLNEKVDRWADEGRVDIDNVRWDGPSLQPTFSWTEAGVEHRCSIKKTLRIRVHLKVSETLHSNIMVHTSTHRNCAYRVCMIRNATYCNTLQETAVRCNALPDTDTKHCKTLQRTAMHCKKLQRTATRCKTLQCTATHCNALHRTATH